MLSKMLDILFGKLFFSVDGASGGGGSSDGGQGSGQGDGGASGSGQTAGVGEVKLPEGFSEEKWNSLKDVDPERWSKVKDIDPEVFGRTKNFYDRVAGDSALFEKVNKIIEQHESTFSNPEYKRIADELKTMKAYIENQENEKNAKQIEEYQQKFDKDLELTSSEVAKELKFENVLDFDKELIKETVLKAFEKDQQGEKKLTIKDLKTLVTDAVKRIDGYRREVLKGAVKKDSAPDPIKDGKTGEKVIERDLKSKDSRVEEAQRFLQEQFKTA